MTAPKPGDRERVTIETSADHARLVRSMAIGSATPSDQLSVTSEELPPPEPDWWPPTAGDVVRLDGAPPKVVWVRNHILGESTSWRSSAGELSHDAAILAGKPTLLVRDGRPVQ